MEKIIISGASGFVGSNLCLSLQNKYLINQIKRYDLKRISSIDLYNTKAFIHLAGKAHDLKKTSLENEYFEVNTNLTERLFDEFLISKCEVFIYMSSVKAVADKLNSVLTEDTVPKPQTAYGKSKLAAESYILSKKIPRSKRVYILRPCMIHGPNNKGNLNLLFSFVSKGVPYPFGKYINKRSFVSIDNLCFIINELIDNTSIESGIYNVADDISLSTIELVQIISEVLNKPCIILKTPKLVVKCLAKIGDFLPIPVNSERLLKLTENYEVSNLKIKNAINKKLPLSSSKGIKKTITSFKVTYK